MAQTIQENYGIIFENIIFLIYEYLKFDFSKFLKGKPTIAFVCLGFFEKYFFGHLLNIYFLKCFLWRWGLKNDTFFITKQHPNLDLNFISIKKHEIQIWWTLHIWTGTYFFWKFFGPPPPKKIGISERFQRTFGGGILVF